MAQIGNFRDVLTDCRFQVLTFILASGSPTEDTSTHGPKSNVMRAPRAQPEPHHPMHQRWVLH
jgi:hypothetical protein